MRSRVEKYRQISAEAIGDYVIGCILLQSTFFWEEPYRIPVPNWAPSIVRGKGYDDTDPDAANIWSQVHERLNANQQELEILEAALKRQSMGRRS